MASENVKNWDLPLSTPESSSEQSDDELTTEQLQHQEQLNKLKGHVEKMQYKTPESVKASPYTEYLAQPRKRTLIDNAKQFPDFMEPVERGKRLERLASKFSTITSEKLEKIVRCAKAEARKKEDISKRKASIYYELLTKLELQNKTQYLNHILKKFAKFIATLSVTIHVPPILYDPYARMQRGLFCTILHSIGVETSKQDSIYYNTSESSEYAVCHKMSHALLSLIIKALDLASTRSPNLNDNTFQFEDEDAMDMYIKDRLMQAAQKKILKCERNKEFENERLDKKL